MDEHDEDCECDVVYADCADTSLYRPLSFSWHTLAHNVLTAGAAFCRAGGDFVESVAGQFGCSSTKARMDEAKADAATEAKRMLDALDAL